MELVCKRALVLLLLLAAFLVAGLALTTAGPSLGLGGIAYAGEDDDDDDEEDSEESGGGDGGGAPAGGADTGGGGTAGSDVPVWPMALGGLVILAGGTTLAIRRIAKEDR